MTWKAITQNGRTVAVVTDSKPQLVDTASATDLLITAKYEYHADRLAIAKEAVSEEFFRLSSGLAGEVLQKFINYQAKFAVFGDFSHYTSKPLHDFIYESSQGKDVFFAPTEDEAVRRLANA
jgi:hypothetical protein